MLRAGAASLSILCFCAAAFGTFLPLRDEGGIQYLYVWPGPLPLVAAAAAAVAFVAAVYLAVAQVARRHGAEAHAAARSGRWLQPVTALGAVALGVLPAVPGAGEYGAPVAYLLYDLRWWWAAVLISWTAVRADRLLRDPMRNALVALGARVGGRWRLPVLTGLLFLAVVAWAIVTTPHLRFSADLHGDEPKYVRYCELWFQGGGLEITGKKQLTDADVARVPQLHRTVALFVSGCLRDARAFLGDLRQFAGDPDAFRWNRARGESGFLSGKDGGLYQKYQPGASAFLFPGYVVDRMLPGMKPGYQDEFPAALPMTNLMMLLVFGACAAVLFHVLRHALATSDALAWWWAAAAMTTLPTGAFAFQLYPELPGLLLFLASALFVLFQAGRASTVTAALAGAAAGGLAWLHPRFLLLSLVVAATGVARTHGTTRRSFAAACALVYASVGAYAYHVTGSWMPTALWDATDPEGALVMAGLPLNLAAYALHRVWGVLPHAPILIAALPGLVLLARDSRVHALFICAAVLALAIPAAGHTLSAAGGTPGRLVMAGVPILIWPVALFIRRYWSSAAVRAATVLLLVVSVESAVSYNRHHRHKAVGVMHAATSSGWRLNLAFPVISEDGWLYGGWYRDDYLPEDAAARRQAAEALLAQSRCALCFTSRASAIDWRWLEPNPARDIRVENHVDGRTSNVHVALVGDGPGAGFGRMRVEFGDGSVTPWMALVGERRLTHTYDAPGEYRVSIWVELRTGEQRGDRRTITVR